MIHHRDRDAHRELSETPRANPRRRITDKPDYILRGCIVLAVVAQAYAAFSLLR